MKDQFFRHYANLPINIRKDIILDLKEKGGPITWDVAYREIKADTDLGKEILERLVELKFIPE
jgi:predicted transcriptional regulator